VRSVPRCHEDKPRISLSPELGSPGSCSEVGDSQRGSEAVNKVFEGSKAL
jgi:hypothetical protein